MTPLVIVIAVVVATALVVAFALVTIALRADRNDPEATVLTVLGKVSSPSGRPFFASSQAKEEFVATLEDARDDVRSQRDERRSASA